MAKHVLDRQRRRKSSRIVPFAEVDRRTAPEGTSPAAKVLLRRAKGPWNAALRTRAYLRIERGGVV